MNNIRYQLLSLITCFLILTSCQKEMSYEAPGDLQDPALLGVWTFVSEETETISEERIIVDTDIMRSITTSHYITKNNTGTLTIDPARMTLSNYSYTIDTTVYGEIYENDVFLYDVEMPFNFDMPPVNTVQNYTLVGADSIYFPAGGIISMEGAAAGIPTVASGSKYRVEGNKLTLITRMNIQTESTEQGLRSIRNAGGIQTVTFQKP